MQSKQRSIVVFVSFTLLASGLATLAAGVTIRIAADSDVGEAGKWTKARTEEWATKTGNRVEYLNLPPSANDVLTLFSQYWAAHTPDMDIYLLTLFGSEDFPVCLFLSFILLLHSVQGPQLIVPICLELIGH